MQASRNSPSGPRRPRPRVLHLVPPPVLPHAASPGSSLGAQRLPEESKLAALGTACSARSAHEDCRRVRPSQRARVLRSLQKPLAWEGRDSSRMSLSTTSSRACGAPAIRAGHRSSGEKPIGIGRLPLSEAQAGSSSPEHSHPPAALRVARSLVLDSVQLLLSPVGRPALLHPPCPPRIPTPQQGPRDQLPLGERTGVRAQRCRHQTWGHRRRFSTASVFNSRESEARGRGPTAASWAARGGSDSFVPSERRRLQGVLGPRAGAAGCRQRATAAGAQPAALSCPWPRNRWRGRAASVCHSTSPGTGCLLPECARQHTREPLGAERLPATRITRVR